MSEIDPCTPEGVAKIAHLSRLALSDAEQDAMCGHMRKILDWARELEELDTEGVSASLHDAAASSRREDVVRPSLPVKAALANAPAKNTLGFLVPAVLAE